MAISDKAKRYFTFAMANKEVGEEIMEAIESGDNASVDADIQDLENSVQEINERIVSGITDPSGLLAVPSLTGSESVVVTLQEDPGAGFVFSHVVVSSGQLQVFLKDPALDATPAASLAVAAQIS